MSVVEERYARALFNLTSDKESADAAEVALFDVVKTFDSNADFKEFMRNPLIAPKFKHELVGRVFDGLPDVVRKFLDVLIDKFRIIELPGIFRQYVEMCNERNRMLPMIIYSAMPITDAQVKAIEKIYAKKLGTSGFSVQTTVDASLIGGVKVVVGDNVFDGSLKTRFTALRGAITEKLQAAKIN